MKAKHRVLSTKKLEPSLVQKASEHGIEIIEQEAISIKPVWSEEKFNEVSRFLQKPYVAFTSANAVAGVEAYLHAHDGFNVPVWKIFCLSGKTKRAVLQTPVLPNAIVGEAESAAALAGEILKQDVQEIVFFCGNKRRDELPAVLKAAGVLLHEVVVYETVATPVKAAEGADAVLFFSPSAVQSFFSVNGLKEDVVCFAVGNTTTFALGPFTGNQVITSIAPDPQEMLEDVIQHFNKKPVA